MMTRVKICGVTSAADARVAVDAGADAIGLIFAESRRKVTIGQAREIVGAIPPFVSVVGVFLDQPEDHIAQIVAAVGIDAIQLHGAEPPESCIRWRRRIIKRFNVLPDDTAESIRERMAAYDVSAYLLDPGAGSGEVFDWNVARGLDVPLIVSGGLNPGNVGEAMRVLRPMAVDVASGVERELGVKDPAMVREFIESVRRADAQLATQ